MPWVNFTCPDGEKIAIDDCIKQCRMEGGRCVALPTLMMFKNGRREWKGLISTTQALNGTRLEYLKILRPYSESPCSRAFALLGTFHHIRFQKMNLPNTLSEEWMEDEYGSGMFDHYDDGELYDFKTVGAWKICRWLGKFTVEEPTGEVFKTGPRKGQEKMRRVWVMRDPEMFELKMQLSRYAWMLRDAGFPVNKAWCQATVRDYTNMTARMYGLDRQIYLIPVDLFSREVVVDFYRKKQEALTHAIGTGEIPPVCEPDERWDDRRCMAYCPVWSYCDHGMVMRTKAKEEEEQ